MPKVTVDVSGYRAQAREALVKKATEAADKVRRWGDVVELEPLSAFDRRIIHQALKDDPHIETHSVEVQGTREESHPSAPQALALPFPCASFQASSPPALCIWAITSG